MNRTAGVILAIVAVALLATTGVMYQKNKSTTAAYNEVKMTEQQSETRYSDAINAIAEIQDSLQSIAVGDSGVRMLSNELQGEQRLSPQHGQEALDRIAELKAGIQRTKERIAALEEHLHKSGVKIAGLQRMITNLKQTVSEREEMVASLTTRVDSLQTQVTGLVAEVQSNQDTIRARDETLEMRRKELGTIYYVVGDTKTLKKAGIVEAKGGVLGINKTLKPTGNFNEAMFTAVDTDVQTTVEIPAKKAQVLSAQSPTSYRLQVNGTATELVITDPTEFRKIKHLVIVTS
jgi:peptidoglycan hydrolase CwlO-like protein